MIKKYRLILIAAFALVASVCLFAGCKLAVNKSYEDFINENQIKSKVTYILNEGAFADNSTVLNIYYPANAKPYEITQSTPPGASIGNALVKSYTGHEFLGWYLADTNEEGIPYYTDGTLYGSELTEGEKKAVSMTKEKFDFSQRLNDGDDIYLVADWNELPKVVVRLIADGFTTLTTKDGVTYENGDEISSYYIPSSGLESMGKYVFTAEGYTFLSFHANADGNDKFDGWPIMVPENGDDVTIYAKFIEGDWEIVTNASDFAKLFRSGGNLLNYYFMLEDGKTEIDLSNVKNLSPVALYGGKIAGNGCTVKNLTLTRSNITTVDSSAAMFGVIKSTAEISDITFENVTINYSLMRNADASAYFVCSNIEAGAKLENVTIGGKIEITLNNGSYLDNTDEDNWIFGLASQEAVYGITVATGSKCVINYFDGTQAEYEYKTNTESED